MAFQACSQSFIVDPTSIHIEKVSSNWQVAVIYGFRLTGSYGFQFYRVDIPPIEVGMPVQLSEKHDRAWVIASRARKDIGWAADRAAYLCAQNFVANRNYYTNPLRVSKDFMAEMTLCLNEKIPGVRVRFESMQTPDVERSKVQFKVISFQAYLLHLGI